MKKAKFISIILVFCILIGGASLWLFAKEDGEISKEELDELGHIVDQGGKEIKDGIESIKEVSEKSEGDKK